MFVTVFVMKDIRVAQDLIILYLAVAEFGQIWIFKSIWGLALDFRNINTNGRMWLDLKKTAGFWLELGLVFGTTLKDIAISGFNTETLSATVGHFII